jgi:hypothetical protein
VLTGQLTLSYRLLPFSGRTLVGKLPNIGTGRDGNSARLAIGKAAWAAILTFLLFMKVQRLGALAKAGQCVSAG